jgi:hypothetical protein
MVVTWGTGNQYALSFALLACALSCSSTSVNDGSGGANGTGGVAKGGTGASGGGGTPSGGAGASGGSGGAAGGTGADGGSAGSLAGGSAGCAAPYAKELGAAVESALPSTFTWADFSSFETNGGCASYAIWQCINAPCAQCPITWKAVTSTSGKVFIDFTANCNAPGKYGCPASGMSPCAIVQNGFGTLTLELGSPSLNGKDLKWSVTNAAVLGTWSGNSCLYFHQAEAALDLNTEMGKAMPKALAGTCP